MDDLAPGCFERRGAYREDHLKLAWAEGARCDGRPVLPATMRGTSIAEALPAAPAATRQAIMKNA